MARRPAGSNSGSDWDSATPGDQTVAADGTRTVIVNGGGGNDSITVVARTTELASSGLNGDAGDDVITGPDSNDTLTGGDGNDRLVAGKGDDVMNGGAGNDTLVWNQGDGSDSANGDAGNDGAEVNGAPTLGDVFTLDPIAGADRPVPADEPGSVHVRRRDRALRGQRPRRRRLGHRERRRGRAHAAVRRRRRRRGHGQRLRRART